MPVVRPSWRYSRVPVAARYGNHLSVITKVHEREVVAHLVRFVAAVFLVIKPELSPLVVAFVFVFVFMFIDQQQAQQP